jgi:hypothetical protein
MNDSKVCINLILISINKFKNCKKPSFGPRKVVIDGKNGEEHVKMQ